MSRTFDKGLHGPIHAVLKVLQDQGDLIIALVRNHCSNCMDLVGNETNEKQNEGGQCV